MLNTSKETLLQHGRIITDFANEEYPDDAVRSYFRNLSTFLNFSKDFEEKVNGLFPYLDEFEVLLTPLDKNLFIMLSEEKRIKSYLHDQLTMNGYGLKGYNAENNTLSLVEIHHEGGSPDDFTIIEEGPFDIGDLKNEIGDELDPEIYKLADKLIQTGKEIKRMRERASEHVKNDPLPVAERYDAVKYLHGRIENIQSEYRNILLEITNGEKLYNIPEFNSFLMIYQSLRHNVLTISDENYLIENPPAGQKIYLRERSPEKWYQTMEKHLSYVLIEFFRIKDSYKHIKICDECHNFYISKIIRSQRFCSPKCRLKWNNRKRIESGEHKEYKRQKRKKGAKASYYG